MAKKKNPKLAKYNYLLSEYSKLNKQLPEDRKLSSKEARTLVSKFIYPVYKDVPKYKIKKRDLRKRFESIIESIPPKQGCDPNLISPEVYRSIDAFALDEYLTQIIPNCVNVKVNAGELGETKIFNTRNYSYTRSGVRNIIEELRKYADEISSDIEWTGIQAIKPNKPNDGTPDNYYIEFVLVLNGEQVVEVQQTRYKPDGKRGKQKATKVTNVIRERISNLKAKKRKKKSLRSSVRKTATKIKGIKKRIQRTKTAKYKNKYVSEKTDILLKELGKLKKAYDKGIISKEDYNKLKSKLQDEFEQGGEI
jgi:hypothetical protein